MMIADSYIVPECVVKPGSFGALMALYESNFIKLTTLVGDIALHGDAGDLHVSTSLDDFDLYLSVESTERYTRVLRLTYFFAEDDTLVADPDLVIRLYLDARMAEVAGWAAHHRHALLRDLAGQYDRELDRRWSNNMMLSKWLDYLYEVRHTFTPTAAETSAIRRAEATTA